MMKYSWKEGITGCFLAVLCILATASSGRAGDGDASSPDWAKAGREIKQAAKAVGEATKETWHIAKEKGKEAWQETKEGTREAIKETKQKIHEATAPSQESGVETGQETPEAESTPHQQSPDLQAPADEKNESGGAGGQTSGPPAPEAVSV